jgi:CRP-like cAMP-binding protein
MSPFLTEKTHLIRKLESVTPLSAEEKHAVLELPMTQRPLGAREEIVRDGDVPDACVLILKGFACRYKHTASGARQIFSLHIPGDIPDLHSLFLERMDHSLGTIAPSHVAFISHGNIRNLIRRYPRVAEALWRDMLVDAAVFRQWIMRVGRRAGPERIAHLFCEQWMRLKTVGLTNGNTCELPLTQTDIADALGLSTVHVNRSLQTLRQEGLIDLRKGELTVVNWDRLCKRAEFDPAYLHLVSPFASAA